MRTRIVEADLVDAVIGLGRSLFYNSAMPACVVICRTEKPTSRKGRVLFIDASTEIREEKTQSWLDPEHIERIVAAYRDPVDEPGFSKLVDTASVLENGGSLRIGSYIPPSLSRQSMNDGASLTLPDAWCTYDEGSAEFWNSMAEVLRSLESAGSGGSNE